MRSAWRRQSASATRGAEGPLPGRRRIPGHLRFHRLRAARPSTRSSTRWRSPASSCSLVVFIFLQDWRATLIPALTIPVSLIGVFAVLLAFGFSANTVTLFALILAIGLVVDDAIVVVENVQRVMEEEPGHLNRQTPRTRRWRRSPARSSRPRWCCSRCSLPVAFLPGITGQLYRQFAITHHRLGGDLRAQRADAQPGALRRVPAAAARRRGPFRWFNHGPRTTTRNGYSGVNRLLARRSIVAGLIVVAVRRLAATGCSTARRRPSSRPRTRACSSSTSSCPTPPRCRARRPCSTRSARSRRTTDGVANVVTISGYCLLSGASSRTAAWPDRHEAVGRAQDAGNRPARHLQQAQRRISPRSAPPTSSSSRRRRSPASAMPKASISGWRRLAASRREELAQVDALLHRRGEFRSAHRHRPIRPSRPRCRASSRHRPRQRAAPQRADLDDLQHAAGAARLGLCQQFHDHGAGLPGQRRRPISSLPPDARRHTEDLCAQHDRRDGAAARLRDGQDTICSRRCSTATTSSPRRRSTARRRPASRRARPWRRWPSSPQTTLPQGYAFEWSSLSYQEALASGQTVVVFALAIIFGYLFLVAQYESWTIPFAVIASVVVAMLGAILGIKLISSGSTSTRRSAWCC